MTLHLRLFTLAGIFVILLASCGPSTAPVSTAIPMPAATPIAHAPEIRFALIGAVTDANVWALFDAKGYSYNNYTLRSEYWPRLYRLSIPGRQFEPMAANGMPSSVQPEGNFFTATVPLRSDLKWTDGSAFSAEDVAFTVNTALSFQLGFDWSGFYNPDYLDHAEAIDARTAKFFFKKTPNVSVWQYGALQGPLVQKAYWLPKITASKNLLPSSDISSQMDALKLKVDDQQKKVDALNTSIASAATPPDELRRAQADLVRRQADLSEAINNLAKTQSEFDSAMKAAGESLYALDDKDEPTLGNWIPAGQEDGAWINKVNPAFPFGQPHFDRAIYRLFDNDAEALKALQNNDVDMKLASAETMPPAGLSVIAANLSNNIRVLSFNQGTLALADVALRQAIACMIWQPARSNSISSSGFVLPGNDFWRNPQAEIPCADVTEINIEARVERALQILKSAGYTWSAEPAWNTTIGAETPGKDLVMPNGKPFPPVVLLSPSGEYDEMQALEADYITQRTRILGVPLTTKLVSPAEVRFAVFSSRQYDMAILGWRLGEYPGYLCDWFGDGNPFHYDGSRLKSACEALNSTSDLDQAQKQVYEIQSILAQDLPFIPLYSGLTYDAYRNITYPFDSVPGGLSGIYGAPSLAVPASQ